MRGKLEHIDLCDAVLQGRDLVSTVSDVDITFVRDLGSEMSIYKRLILGNLNVIIWLTEYGGLSVDGRDVDFYITESGEDQRTFHWVATMDFGLRPESMHALDAILGTNEGMKLYEMIYDDIDCNSVYDVNSKQLRITGRWGIATHFANLLAISMCLYYYDDEVMSVASKRSFIKRVQRLLAYGADEVLFPQDMMEDLKQQLTEDLELILTTFKSLPPLPASFSLSQLN